MGKSEQRTEHLRGQECGKGAGLQLSLLSVFTFSVREVNVLARATAIWVSSYIAKSLPKYWHQISQSGRVCRVSQAHLTSVCVCVCMCNK